MGQRRNLPSVEAVRQRLRDAGIDDDAQTRVLKRVHRSGGRRTATKTAKAEAQSRQRLAAAAMSSLRKLRAHIPDVKTPSDLCAIATARAFNAAVEAVASVQRTLFDLRVADIASELADPSVAYAGNVADLFRRLERHVPRALPGQVFTLLEFAVWVGAPLAKGYWRKTYAPKSGDEVEDERARVDRLEGNFLKMLERDADRQAVRLKKGSTLARAVNGFPDSIGKGRTLRKVKTAEVKA